MLNILIPAAGLSARMRGVDKLLEDVSGDPCLRVIARRALQVSSNVIITLPDENHPRMAALSGLDVTVLPVADPASGMSVSLRVGVASLAPKTTALMILLADMPDITAHDMAQLWAVFQASGLKILQAATHSGETGHPVIFDKVLFPEFANLKGDTGAAALIKANPKSYGRFALSGDRARQNLNTPEQWATWRAGLG